MSPDDPRHGTVNGYTNLACRCEKCRKAWADYQWRNGYARNWMRKTYKERRARAAQRP